MQTPPESWTEEQKTEYNNQIKELLKTDNNTSYASLNEKIAKITEIKNKIAGNINPEESSLTIGGVLVENGVVNLTDTNNFEIIKKGDILISALTININPTTPSELNIKKLYELVQKLTSYGITPAINTNDEVTYTINGGDEYIYDEVEYYNTLGGNDLREMGNLNTNKLEIKATFMSGYVIDRVITAKNNAKIKITGNYLDIGENTFIAEDTSSYSLAETIKLTNYNDYYEELWDSKPAYLHYKPISQEKMIDQFTLFGLNKEMATAPKFDIMLGEATDLFKLSKDLLNKYTTFPSESKLDSLSSTFDGYEKGKSLYNGDILNKTHQAVQNPINIKLAEFLGQLPSNAVLDMTGKDSNKIYEFRVPDANLIINGDASNVSISNGYSAGFIIANGAAPITIGYTDLYKYSQLPKEGTGGYTSNNTIIDFRGVDTNVNYSVNKFMLAEHTYTLYIENSEREESLKNKIKVNYWFINVYYSDNNDPNIKTLQDFESIGNDALKHTANNSVSKVNFIDPDTNTILYSALNSREYNS